jgi:hypothetical protein
MPNKRTEKKSVGITAQDLLLQREQIQEDLLCVLDGQPDAITESACQTVVNGFKKLIDKL